MSISLPLAVPSYLFLLFVPSARVFLTLQRLSACLGKWVSRVILASSVFVIPKKLAGTLNLESASGFIAGCWMIRGK